MSALAHAAQRRGAIYLEHTPVLGLKAQGGGYQVQTPAGSLRAGQVLLASGISQVGPFGWIRRRIVPVGAFLIVTEPLPAELLAQLLPTRRMYTDTKNFVNYFRATPDNRLLFGGRARCRVQSAVRRQERRDPARPDAGGVPATGQGPHRLLLGRHGRHDRGPPAACRTA
jgi:glycine/D-amino acid oxidase-like deaminating enzyme